jgi:hypothetical protein
VLHARVGISSGASDLALSIDDYRANIGIRRREPDALARQFERMLKMFFVGGVG